MDIQEIKLFDGYESDLSISNHTTKKKQKECVQPLCFFAVIALVSAAVSILIIYIMNRKF